MLNLPLRESCRFDLLPLILLAGSLSVTACGSEGKNSAQVAARVNADEITIHQVNYLLEHTPDIGTKDTDSVRQEILEKLIDEEVVLQQAIERKLDHSAEVMAAIEAARRQLLAQAYLKQSVAALPKPSAAEIRKYYDSHPELFAQGQIYELRALNLKPDAEVQQHLEEMVMQGKSLDDVMRYLKGLGIPARTQVATMTSEQIPLNIAPGLARLGVGGLLTAQSPGNGFQIIRIDTLQSNPVSLADATPRIEQFLVNQNAAEFISKEVLRLRKLAKVEYVGHDGMKQLAPLDLPAKKSPAMEVQSPSYSTSPSLTSPLQ